VSDLEIDKEAVEFLLAGSTVKVLATRLKQDTDQTDAEQVLWRVQQWRTCVYSNRMSRGLDQLQQHG